MHAVCSTCRDIRVYSGVIGSGWPDLVLTSFILHGHCYASWYVRQPDSGFGFVYVLSTCPTRTHDFNLDIIQGEQVIVCFGRPSLFNKW